jgi:DNA modification methylase
LTVRILQGDCRDVLKTLPDESVHCVVTSPPYWGLRDYGVAGQLGLENSPGAFVDALVGIFSEARRVLRPDGTVWLNLGDSYAGGGNYRGINSENTLTSKQASNRGARGLSQQLGALGKDTGLEPKNLVGIPWRVALALQDAGWWLRQDIIWHKPNPMPESVTDRCTKAHEYIFLLAKSERYYFDAEAIKEPGAAASGARYAYAFGGGLAGRASREVSENGIDRRTVPIGYKEFDGTRNKRTVWTVPTSPFQGAHFATFPPDLIEPCILAGCPEGGTVLDPFGGAGTTGLVADRHKRNAILIELNPEYAEMAKRRITNDSPLFADVC